MNIKKQLSCPRIIAFMLLGLLPFALLCLGIFLNLASIAFDLWFVLSYIALPFACLTVLFVSIFSNLKLRNKVILCATVLTAFLSLVFSLGLIGG